MSKEFSEELIREFVINSHGNRARVEEMLAEEPELLNVYYEPFDETPLGAASHVGNRSLAEFFLESGAPMTICTAAMLGRRDEVERFIAADPAAASERGAHGIPLLAHAAFSGDSDLCALILEKGDGSGLDAALHNAVLTGDSALVDWLLEQGANPAARNWQDKSAVESARALGNSALADRLAAALPG